MNKKSKFIAIEGLDGAGKSTQIELLLDYLKNEGVNAKFVHFPRHNEGVFGNLISKFLRGEFGNVESVHPQLVALLFAEDRKDFAYTINQWLEEGCFVVVDRYVYSNIAYQCAKTKDEKEKAKLKDWILNFEFEYNKIPKPDYSLFLDVPFSFTLKALNEKRTGAARDYLEGSEDIHEKDFSLQVGVKNEYDKLVLSETNITKITCYGRDEKMMSVLEIHKKITETIGK